MLFTLERLSYSYSGGVEALREISLTICDGERIAIVGENGSGKTTLGKILAGLLMPVAGSIKVDRSRNPFIAYSFQNPDYQLFRDTVREELELGLTIYHPTSKSVNEKVRVFAQRFGVAELMNESPSELPYGTRKLLSIATIMVLDPHVLILDEPTAGLDETGFRSLDAALSDQLAEGKCLIVISHDIEFIAKQCSRVVWLENGSVRYDGSLAGFLQELIKSGQTFIDLPLITKVGRKIVGPDSILMERREIINHWTIWKGLSQSEPK